MGHLSLFATLRSSSVFLKVEVNGREQATLNLAATLFSYDKLTSRLRPGFNCLVSKLF